MSNKDDRIYSILRRDYLMDHPRCEAGVTPICTYRSTQIHHKKGRGKFLTEVNTFLACCFNCHRWIEDHPKAARELGFSESRFK